MSHRIAAIVIGALALSPGALLAQQPITPADYGKWESLGAGTLSPDGRWLAYGLSRVDETAELRLHGLARDTTIILANASGPRFTGGSAWVAYSIGVSAVEREKLTAAKQPVHNQLGLMNLRTLVASEIDRVASFDLSPDGRYVAMRGYPPEGSTQAGADLLVRELATGATVSFGNVGEFSWSDQGALLAMTMTTQSGVGNGTQTWDPATGTVRVLDSSTSLYRSLSWRADANELAVLRTRTDSAHTDTAHVILAWRNVRAGEQPIVFDPARVATFPAEMRIAEYSSPQWTRDGTRILFGIQPRIPAPKRQPTPDSTDVNAAKTDVELSDVQVWHANDFRIFPMQKVQENRDVRRTLLAAWRVADGAFVQAGTDLMETTAVTADGRFATETDVEPYRFAAMFGRQYNDIWLTDLDSGKRTKVIEKVASFSGASETGRYLLYFEGKDFWTYDTKSGRRTNITASSGGSFVNSEYDYPVEQYPSFGFAGWTRGDAAILLYDKYDIWSVAPDGSRATRLTDGARDSVVHRYARTGPDEDGIDVARPMYLNLTGEWSKKNGWGRMRAGRQVERLVFEDRSIGRLMKADSAPVYGFTSEDFDDSPDWFVGDAELTDARQITNTNAFQTGFAWGRSELIEYTSQTGRRLQGALLYPAGWQPGRTYPMLVYQYEILSPTVHRYVTPSERSYYNHAVFTANGYFVLLPDIVYRAREPGRSAVEAIVPAVKSVVDRGLVDASRVGLVGHSWGGYQAAYVPTQTNIFAASVAGAPLTNFLSMMGAIHWSGGLPETGHWETGQARMEVPYWEDFDAHVRNSPAAFIEQLETPMLMMFGDADGTVDWHQGVEFYNFARRAGKTDFVLLVYPGEDHGLRQKKNQIDYQQRILQWFGHWLKHEPAPKWITDGVTFLERKKTLEAGTGGR